MQSDTESNIFCEPSSGSDLSHLRASFPGPPDTPYEGGTYIVDIKIPNEYPFRPPAMSFTTKLWHPNVSSQTVSNPSPLVKTPANNLRVLFASIQSAQPGPLSSPSNPPSSPFNPFSARLNQKTPKMQKWHPCL